AEEIAAKVVEVDFVEGLHGISAPSAGKLTSLGFLPGSGFGTEKPFEQWHAKGENGSASGKNFRQKNPVLGTALIGTSFCLFLERIQNCLRNAA
ncbi:MAG: hypothetical protein ACLFPR_16985, partial [Desulfococcaceae bacterium]